MALIERGAEVRRQSAFSAEGIFGFHRFPESPSFFRNCWRSYLLFFVVNNFTIVLIKVGAPQDLRTCYSDKKPLLIHEARSEKQLTT